MGSVNVYWVTPEQISKKPPAGQYLNKGAFMIRGSKNFVRNVQLQIAIGVKAEKERVSVIGGPPTAIAHQTDLYIKILPGEQTSSRLAKQMRKHLAEMAPTDWKKAISEIPLEEIQRFIPLGRGRVRTR